MEFEDPTEDRIASNTGCKRTFNTSKRTLNTSNQSAIAIPISSRVMGNIVPEKRCLIDEYGPFFLSTNRHGIDME